MRSSVSFAFYSGLGDKEPLINRITAMFTGPYMHCEIVFTDSKEQHVACGVWQGECTFMRRKTFGKKCWVWRTLTVTSKQERVMRRFCAMQAKMQIPFNRWGLIRCCTACPKKTDGKSWFCSELCVSALQAAGLLVDEIASACTPTHVFQLVEKLGAYRATAPGCLLDERINKKKLRYTFGKRAMVV